MILDVGRSRLEWCVSSFLFVAIPRASVSAEFGVLRVAIRTSKVQHGANPARVPKTRPRVPPTRARAAEATMTNNTQEPGYRQPEAVASLQSFKEDEPGKRFPLVRARCGVGTQQRGRRLRVQSLVKSEIQRPTRRQMLRRIHPTVQLPQLEKLSSCNQSTESCSAPLRRLTMTGAISSTRRCEQKSNSQDCKQLLPITHSTGKANTD